MVINRIKILFLRVDLLYVLMEFLNFTPVSIIYFVAIGISLLLALLAVRISSVKGAKLFSVMMVSVCLWIASSMLNVFTLDEPFKFVLLKIEYVGMGSAVYLWLVFVSKYTQYEKWLKKSWVYIVLAIIPLITIFQVLRAPEGTYIRESYNFVYVNGLKTFEKNFAVGFFIWTAYAYITMLTGFVLIVVRILQTPINYRKQLYYIIPIVFIVIVPNVFFITGNSPIKPYDPTPLSLVLVGILFLITMYFHNFLSIGPVAQDLILNNIKSGVVVVDNHDKVTEINTIAESIIGLNGARIIGKQLSDILPEVSCLLKNGADSEEIKAEVNMGDEKRDYELKIAPLKDKMEKKRGHVLMFWDITDQKMALSELDAYARTVAHDLKTPLGHIMGFAKLLGDDDITETEKIGYQDNIVKGGEKMRSIIDGLLMLAKIRNQDKLEKSVFNMQEVLDSVMLRMNSTIFKAQAKVTLPQSWPNPMGNAIWVEEVWINLFSNAIKYGGNPPEIELGFEELDGKYKFWIKDNGAGLSEEEQSLLFSEFNRLHPKKESIKGHGLGLSIVQRVVNKLGGDTGVYSKISHGSTFYFTLKSSL